VVDARRGWEVTVGTTAVATPRQFICSVGVSESYRETVYAWEGREFRTRFAPVAVAHLCELRGAQASVVGTDKAIARWYDQMAAELRCAEVNPTPVLVPEGRDDEEIMRILDTLASIVGEGQSVTLDITFALRHLSFAYFAAVVYLTALRGVRIEGVFYGAYELRNETTNVAPILDLASVVRIVRWYHAVQAGVGSGDLRPMAAALRDDAARLFRLAGARALSAAQGPLDKLSRSLATGLPVEAGIHASGVIACLKRPLPPAEAGRSVGSALLALDQWRAQIEGLALPLPVDEKRRLQLTEEELQRQMRVAEWYLGRSDLLKVQLLLREWLVSLVLLRSASEVGWLVRATRRSAEAYLQGLSERAQHGLTSTEEETLARLWQGLSTRRNSLAHCGMSGEDVDLHGDRQVRDKLEGCKALLNSDLSFVRKVVSTGRGPLLVTPLGLSPGVIFTAVKVLDPDEAIIVSSAEAAGRINEALTAAGRPGLRHRVLALKDPHRGFDEAKVLIDQELRRALVSPCREVVVNITGGTTCLQYTAEAIGRQASRLGLPVRTVALVDRRSIDEQRANPYVVGHIEELDVMDAE
jgi:hypothetical protein